MKMDDNFEANVQAQIQKGEEKYAQAERGALMGAGRVGLACVPGYPSEAEREKQWQEEKLYRREQDARQARAGALEAAIRIMGEIGAADPVVKAAKEFEAYLNGMVSLPATGEGTGG